MYSMTAGTGERSAPSGSQSRAARRPPSRIGIHRCSISRTAWGKTSTTLTLPPALRERAREEYALQEVVAIRPGGKLDAATIARRRVMEMTQLIRQPCDEGVMASGPVAVPCADSSGPWVLAATI